jgi:hypothetical protein
VTNASRSGPNCAFSATALYMPIVQTVQIGRPNWSERQNIYVRLAITARR